MQAAMHVSHRARQNWLFVFCLKLVVGQLTSATPPPHTHITVML